MLFFEFIINSSQDKIQEPPVYNTLLELYLSDNIGQRVVHGSSGSLDEELAGLALSDEKAAPSSARSNTDTGISKAARYERALDLLKRGWPQANQDPLYDPEQALVLCRLRR